MVEKQNQLRKCADENDQFVCNAPFPLNYFEI